MCAEFKTCFSKSDVRILRRWHEQYATQNNHYGGQTVLFPEEQLLLDQLTIHYGKDFCLSFMQAEMLFDWMKISVGGNYGTSKILLQDEIMCFDKLQVLSVQIDEFKDKQFENQKKEQDRLNRLKLKLQEHHQKIQGLLL